MIYFYLEMMTMKRIAFSLFTFIILFFVPVSVSALECAHLYESNCADKCSLCGEERTPLHTPGSLWLDGGDFHYMPCTDCGEIAFRAPHTKFSYTFTEAGHIRSCGICGGGSVSVGHSFVTVKKTSQRHTYFCDTCGYTFDENHSFSWKIGEDGHTARCDCGYQGGLEKHKYSESCSAICLECGYERTEPHSKTEIIPDGEGHKKICLTCGATLLYEEHKRGQYTVNSLGHYAECSVCSESLGFQRHSATDGSCECGYKEPTASAEEKERSFLPLVFILIGAAGALIFVLVYLNRRRICIFALRLKNKLVRLFYSWKDKWKTN